ncbi:hypothetical protein ACLOJK_033695 [Asimina triloba]
MGNGLLASLGEIAIAAGGIDAQGKTWVAGYNCLAFFLDGKFYGIMGVIGSNREPYTRAEEHDLEKGVWRNVGDTHPAWCAPTWPPISVVAEIREERALRGEGGEEIPSGKEQSAGG